MTADETRPIIDESYLLDLLDGDHESASDIFEDYISDLKEQIDNLRSAIEIGDCNTMRDTAYELKGASASVGAEAMRCCALDLEARAAEGDLVEEEKTMLLSELERQYKALLDLADQEGGIF
jgi:HPt (histidine-containing phosphotransfer) domain-containing protein